MAYNFYNEEHEKALLGMLFIDNTLIDVVKTKVEINAFFEPKHRKVYEVILTQWERHHCVNYVSICEELSPTYAPFVASLSSVVPSSANWEFYVDKINASYLARKMKADLTDIINNLNEDNVNDSLDRLNQQNASYLQIGGSTLQSTQDLCLEITEEIAAAAKRQDQYLGYETGWTQLDDITDGFQTQNLYVLGARPSIGKTACALSLISNLCRKKVPSAFLSLEMSNKSLIYRLLSSEAKLPVSWLKKGLCVSYSDGMTRFQNAMRKVFEYPLNIFDRNIKTDSQIFSCIRYEAKINGTKFFVIDHLGLVKFSNPTAQRYADIGTFTAALKDLAKELDVCIFLLCQCGREAEGKKPNMALLRESGNIEQDADVIMFLHREREVDADAIPTELIVEKNRDGRLGTVKLTYMGNYTKFIEDKGERNEEAGKAPEIIVHKKPAPKPVQQTLIEEDEEEEALF